MVIMIPAKYEELFEYINYFENNGIEFCRWNSMKGEEGQLQINGPVYDEGVYAFIEKIYESDLLEHDYLKYFEQHSIDKNDLSELIKTADFELLKAIITWYVRGERFCDGLWGSAIGHKVFLKILYRLQEIAI